MYRLPIQMSFLFQFIQAAWKICNFLAFIYGIIQMESSRLTLIATTILREGDLHFSLAKLATEVLSGECINYYEGGESSARCVKQLI